MLWNIPSKCDSKKVLVFPPFEILAVEAISGLCHRISRHILAFLHCALHGYFAFLHCALHGYFTFLQCALHGYFAFLHDALHDYFAFIHDALHGFICLSPLCFTRSFYISPLCNIWTLPPDISDSGQYGLQKGEVEDGRVGAWKDIREMTLRRLVFGEV